MQKLLVCAFAAFAAPANGVHLRKERMQMLNESGNNTSNATPVDHEQVFTDSHYDRVEAKTNATIAEVDHAIAEADHLAARAEQHAANGTGEMAEHIKKEVGKLNKGGKGRGGNATNDTATAENVTNPWEEASTEAAAIVDEAAAVVENTTAAHDEAKVAHREARMAYHCDEADEENTTEAHAKCAESKNKTAAAAPAAAPAPASA